MMIICVFYMVHIDAHTRDILEPWHVWKIIIHVQIMAWTRPGYKLTDIPLARLFRGYLLPGVSFPA